MRAAFYSATGEAADVLQVGILEDPEPDHDEVRVRIEYSGVNPSDVKARAGLRPLTSPPIIPHSDGAGVIDKVGSGVPDDRVGQRVWIWNGQWLRPNGTCAEYVVVPQGQAVPLPEHERSEVGACLGIPAMTGAYSVHLAKAGPDVTVLISGGAGSVAHYAIQFAKECGSRVITTVSSETKADVARLAGADHVVDYRREDVGLRIRELTGGHMVDALIEVDFSSNAPLLPDILAPGSVVVVYGNTRATANVPVMFCMRNQVDIRNVYIYELTDELRNRTIAHISERLESGTLTHNVSHVFALEDIVAAHELVEAGTVGNVVIRI